MIMSAKITVFPRHGKHPAQIFSRDGKQASVFAYLETNCYLCINAFVNMELKIIRLIMSDEAKAFVRQQPEKARQKITYNIRRLESGVIDKELFKKLEGSEIWELRTLFNGICYRLFAFWDTDMEALVVATHGIVKKTQKTPKKEIAKAEAIRKEYFNDKK